MRYWTRYSRAFAWASSGALLVLAAPALGAGRRPPVVELSVLPSLVTAGRVLSVRCRHAKPMKTASLRYGEREAAFYIMAPGESRALLGIGSLEAPGERTALFEAEFARGRVFQATVTFAVEAGSYPVSRLALKKEKEQILTSGRLAADGAVLRDFYNGPSSAEKMWSGFFVLPATGVVSSVFGAVREYGNTGERKAHSGLDLANAEGTPVSAPNRGRVVFAGWLDSFGNTVLMDHGHGVFSYYLHMKQLSTEPGLVVETGAPLGLMGAEGLATGPHVHWSMVVAGEKVDAQEWTERMIE